MKRIANFIPVIIALLALTLFAFAGCGDDGSTTVINPGGATGPTGTTGATGNTGVTGPENLVDLTIDIWEGAAGGTRVADPFKVTLVRTMETAEAEEIEVSDTTAEGQAVITDLPSGADYNITVAVFGRIPQTQNVKTAEVTTSISSSQDNTQQTVNFENFGNSLMGYAGTGYYYGTPGYLYVLDPNNPNSDNNVGFISASGISALAFAPAAAPNALPTLYGITGYDAANSGMALVTIDPFTGKVLTSTAVSCSTSNIFYIYDISVDSNGNIYGYGNSNSWDNAFLGTINPSTGAVNIISNYPYYWKSCGLAFDPNGLLYHVGSNNDSTTFTNLGILNVTTGARSDVSNLSQNIWFDGGIDFYNNTLYGHGSDHYMGPENLLYTINTTSGTITGLNGGVNDCTGIAFPK